MCTWSDSPMNVLRYFFFSSIFFFLFLHNISMFWAFPHVQWICQCACVYAFFARFVPIWCVLLLVEMGYFWHDLAVGCFFFFFLFLYTCASSSASLVESAAAAASNPPARNKWDRENASSILSVVVMYIWILEFGYPSTLHGGDGREYVWACLYCLENNRWHWHSVLVTMRCQNKF